MSMQVLVNREQRRQFGISETFGALLRESTNRRAQTERKEKAEIHSIPINVMQNQVEESLVEAAEADENGCLCDLMAQSARSHLQNDRPIEYENAVRRFGERRNQPSLR